MKGCYVVCQCRVDVALGQEMERPGLQRDIILLEESSFDVTIPYRFQRILDKETIFREHLQVHTIYAKYIIIERPTNVNNNNNLIDLI